MDLRMRGEVVTQVRFEYAVTFITNGGMQLTIETEFAVGVAGGGMCSIDPEAVANRELLEGLVGKTIRAASADDGGLLEVSFAGGPSIAVVPDDDYEAWSVIGPDGFKVVALPGGEVATWNAD